MLWAMAWECFGWPMGGSTGRICRIAGQGTTSLIKLGSPVTYTTVIIKIVQFQERKLSDKN